MQAMTKEEAGVLFANESFYAAFAARDLEMLDALWSHASPVACVHPGWPPLTGRKAVMQSWAKILESPASPEILCRAAQAHFLSDDIAYVTCFELIGDDALSATNIFSRESGGWRLVHHQASPTAVAPPREAAAPPPRLQ